MGTKIYDNQIKDNIALTGTPTAPTPSVSDDSTRIATTEFVHDVLGEFYTSHTHAQSDVTNLETALAGKSDIGHNHSGAYVEPTRSVSAGAGLSGGGALSADLTIAMGTPGSCSPSTTNSVSGTTHTHAITGVAPAEHSHAGYAPSSHTHNYAPIPTSSSFPVGFSTLVLNNNKIVAADSTTAGSNLSTARSAAMDGVWTTGVALPGTWKNISGIKCDEDAVALFVRIA